MPEVTGIQMLQLLRRVSAAPAVALSDGVEAFPESKASPPALAATPEARLRLNEFLQPPASPLEP